MLITQHNKRVAKTKRKGTREKGKDERNVKITELDVLI